MRISMLRPIVLGTPWRNLTFLIVETDEGLRGVGEVRMLNHTDALHGYLQEAGPNHILGSDPFNIEDLTRRMFRNDFARAGEIAMSAMAVVEMACWDIVGQALGAPIYRLLGGATRQRIPAYANGWYTVERTPAEFHAAAQRVVARGYRALKVDPFGAGFYELTRAEKFRSIGLIEAVRDAVGPDVEILVEMHGRFNPVTAVELAREINHTAVKAVSDFGHAMTVGEPLSHVVAAAPDLVHVHLRDSGGGPPGTGDYDYPTYFRLLKQVHYRGRLSMECRWTDLAVQAGDAIAFVHRQWTVA